ncbi:hypothetical protein [Paraburkholderia sp. C35]|uniref:hypothetical protein n=1 Tax=Paraburkholderia sp. C35 TaxID=2126993 RepID=UPI0013A5AA47|nr:hypothetical protein [Paraburkholderia sp. C35]
MNAEAPVGLGALARGLSQNACLPTHCPQGDELDLHHLASRLEGLNYRTRQLIAWD